MACFIDVPDISSSLKQCAHIVSDMSVLRLFPFSYETKEDMTFVHRTFDSKDILEYPHSVPRDDVELTKDEYLMYRLGVLEHTTGNVNVKLLPSTAEPVIPSNRYTTETDEQETYDGSFHANKFSVTGSYSLDLEYCYNIPRAAAKQRRDTKESMVKGYTKSTLTAHDNQSKEG